jgi:hypothetical protein
MYIYKTGITKEEILGKLKIMNPISIIDASCVKRGINKLEKNGKNIELSLLRFNEDKCGIPYNNITNILKKQINLYSLTKKSRVIYIEINDIEIKIYGSSNSNLKALNFIKDKINQMEKDYSKNIIY